ncbi:hypothetical protein T484DRAFT_2456993 [Baffinella frigidus]|nr:hypothetical protein T484DRAFT_2456993 [Cryptophyta sp. CCMP2293]
MGDKTERPGPDGGADAGTRQLENQKAEVGPRSIEGKNENSVEKEAKRQGGGDGSNETGRHAAPSAALQGKHAPPKPVAAETGAGGSAYATPGENPPPPAKTHLRWSEG